MLLPQVCQTTFDSWLQALRPLLKEGMWKGHLHPPYRHGLLFVSLGFLKLRFLCFQLWLNKGPMDCFKKDGDSVLGCKFCSNMLTPHLSWPYPYKIMADTKVCACAMVYLLSWLDFPLIWHSASRGWIWSMFKGPLMHLNSSEGRANMQHEKQFW